MRSRLMRYIFPSLPQPTIKCRFVPAPTESGNSNGPPDPRSPSQLARVAWLEGVKKSATANLLAVESLTKLSPNSVRVVWELKEKFVSALKGPLPVSKYRLLFVSAHGPFPPIQMPHSPALAPQTAMVELGLVLKI